jgi:voltage-gated potassium channel
MKLETSGMLKLYKVFKALVAIMVVGTLGYMILEGLSFLDALYMTIITISTVGFGEVAELSTAGKVFTMLIILAGLSTVAYALTNVAAFLLEGEFSEILRRRSMENKIAALKDHYILCGAGQTGASVIERFQRHGVSFVVIENNMQKVEDLMMQGVLVVQGDATHEETLQKACISQSKGLITCLANDSSNVFTVLTARGMNPGLYIVSRAIEKNSHEKLRRAGADNTISPNEIGGARMASLLLRPAVVSFLDIITRAGEVVFDLEEIPIDKESQILGKSLREARIPERVGLIVLAVKKRGEEKLHINPGAEETLDEGDKIIVMGKREQIDSLRRVYSQPAT